METEKVFTCFLSFMKTEIYIVLRDADACNIIPGFEMHQNLLRQL